VPAPWWGGGALGAWREDLRSAGTRRKKSTWFGHAPPSDHVGGLTTQGRKPRLSKCRRFLRREGPKATFWLSPEIVAKRRRMRTRFQSAQAIAAPYIKAGKWHTFSGLRANVEAIQIVRTLVHTPDIPAMNLRPRGKKSCFWGRISSCTGVQLQHPESPRIFDIDQTAATATRNQLLLSSRARMF